MESSSIYNTLYETVAFGVNMLRENDSARRGGAKKFFGIVESNSPWPYFVIYLIPIVWLMTVLIGSYSYWVIPIAFFVIFPLLEILRGQDGYVPDEADYDKLQNDVRYRGPTWFWIVPQALMIFFGAYVINNWDLGFWEKIGLSISTGLITGSIGITISHELMHRNSGIERTLARGLLLSVLYSHFDIEHTLGHHVNVGTYDDPATSRFGENIYNFIPRSVGESYLSSWKIAKVHRLVHVMLLYHVAQIAFLWYIFTVGGLTGVCFTIFQAIVAITLLEAINYVEHYGITREIFEPVTHQHSWNTDAFATNFLIFKLQRHSDHHADARRRYQNLRNVEGSPTLPTGYGGSVILALFPPLWRRIMDPKVLALDEASKKSS